MRRRVSAVALPNGATSGESEMPISEGEGGATAGKRRIRGVANGYGVVRGRSAESSGHQTERVGSSEARALVMGGGKKR